MNVHRSLHGSRVLVIGGTGRTGRHAVDLLLRQGAEVTVGSRRPGHVPPGAASAVLDLGAGIGPEALDGVAAVIVSVEPPADTPGARAVMHGGVARLAAAGAAAGTRIVLVSQIYITRAGEHPGLAGIIEARADGEAALRASGAAYTIVRPGWLTDGPAGGVRLEQGDTGEGRISRASVAAAAVAALTEPDASGKTFEIFDAGGGSPDWAAEFGKLASDAAG